MGRRRVEPDTRTYGRQVGARIRALRERRGKTVEQLATACGVHEQTVYKWEIGQNAVPLDMIPKLYRALECQRFSDLFPPLN